MRNFYTALVLVCLLVSCAGDGRRSGNDTNLGIIVFRSDHANVFSGLFKKNDFIFLESNPDGLVGTIIEKVDFIDDKVFILNNRSGLRNVLCFDLRGKFLFKIDRVGQGPGEYTFLVDFVLDKKEKVIGLYSGDSKKILYYDLEGKFIDERTTPRIWTSRIYDLDSAYLVANNSDVEGQHAVLMLNKKDLSIAQSFFKNPVSASLTPMLPLSFHDGHVLYYMGNDTIYDVTRQCKPAYYVDMGEAEVRDKRSILALSANDDSRMNLFSRLLNGRRVHLAASLIENRDYLVVTYLSRAEERQILSTFLVYSKKDGTSYNSANVGFDIFGNARLSITPIAKYGEKVVSIVDPIISKEDMEKIQQSPLISDAAKTQFLELNEMSNPVILLSE